MSTAIKYPVPDWVKPSLVIFDIRPERQSARMSKITNDGLTRSGTGCPIAVATVGVKGLSPVSNCTFYHARHSAVSVRTVAFLCSDM